MSTPMTSPPAGSTGRAPLVTPPRGGEAARVVNALLGIWLIVSAFAWPHSPAQMTNAWIVGIVAAVFALGALLVDARIRYLNTVVAIWLFISVWALPGAQPATAWNSIIVAFVLFVLSMPASGAGTLRHA
jgi:hypothetical protein